MKKVILYPAVAIATLVGGLALSVGVVRSGALNTSYEELASKYAAPPSQFVDIGKGIKVHIRDEGKGPVILMLHSSMTNLHIWDDWADQLKKNYRVVRLDWPPYGLTIDRSGETGTAHASEVVAAVVDKLGLDKMVLVGSSSGATLSVVYASQNPEKVRALALSTLPLQAPPGFDMPWKMKVHHWVHDNLTPNYKTKNYFRTSLSTYFGDPARVKDEHVLLFYDTNNLEGGYARVNEYYQSNVKNLWSKGASDFAAKVTAPILLQWGDLDPVLPPYLVPKAVEDFRNAKVTVLHYQQGHYPQIENPQETLRDLQKFLAALPDDASERARLATPSA